MHIDATAGQVTLDRGETQPWVEVAISARVMREVLHQTPSPAAGSPLELAKELYPEEPADEWCRSFLDAALEHLTMWADYAVPLKMHPEAKVQFGLRPAQTLARAALESASQAVWVLAAPDAGEMLRRHMSLVLSDWDEQGKAASTPEGKAALKHKRTNALNRLGVIETEVKAPNYLDLVSAAALEVRDKLPGAGMGDRASVERLWRASAGSAHGKRWPASEMTIEVEADRRRISIPDPAAITAILQLADRVMTYGVLRFADRSGHHGQLLAVQRAALNKVYASGAKLPGAPAVLPPFPIH